ncbi:hypothetical protein L6452_12974 [Arctium lappa]|uniref:Uncharacterized protein n=1 Tax=Arctium lappa TaxID=4217 RepID=A0ACB9CGW4_ARCLA|nr:hypothetical protein L6452_12974 [Arctium lappa]
MHWIKPLIKQNSFSPPPTNSSLFSATNIVIVITILVVIMFLIFGLLHFLMRCLMNKMRFSSNSHHQSTRFQENGDGDVGVYQRQLQQLFNLHDDGLDQSSIDALPIFIYKELVGLKEPLHCAVCLCEFLQQDHLRLLPVCSHAFHIHCIDTWLLSNSTCPLCRGSLFTPGFSVINPVFDFDFDFDHSREGLEDGHGVSSPGTTTHDGVFGNFNKQCERVYPVRLGKFRAMNGENSGEEVGQCSSNGNLDERRCYSMGSYEYVVGDSELQVAFWLKGIIGNEKEKVNRSIDEGRDGKEISNGSKGESFSVSKIWLWSKKHHHRFQDSSIPIWVNPLSNVNLP